MSLLTWRSAEGKDRGALQVFTCAVNPLPYQPREPYRPRHPKPWELDVQQRIRGLRPPLGPDEILLVGEDEAGIGAVSYSWVSDNGPSIIKLLAIAVATRHRGQGGAHADEALQVALEAAGERASLNGLASFLAVGWIDRRNHVSKKMAERVGFLHVGNTPAGLEEWTVIVDLT